MKQKVYQLTEGGTCPSVSLLLIGGSVNLGPASYRLQRKDMNIVKTIAVILGYWNKKQRNRRINQGEYSTLCKEFVDDRTELFNYFLMTYINGTGWVCIPKYMELLEGRRRV